MQQLDLNLLKVFESLYREQNMTRTADILNITPSAVSHAVKRLRDSLNDPLFVRQGASMQPTPACRRIAPQLLANLHQLRKTLQQLMDFDPATTEQTFNLAIHSALEPLFIPYLYPELHKLAPKATLICKPLDRNKLQREMAAGLVDVAIDVAQPLGSPIQHLQLSRAPFSVLMKRAHPLANALTQENYLEAQHIAVSNRAKGMVMEDIALQQQGLIRHIAMRCQTFQTACKIVENSELLLTLPGIIAQQNLSEQLIVTPLHLSLPDIETHLYWHENTTHDASLQWFREQVQKQWESVDDGE
ncbi:LysR family transcriptional regulator [Paraneptunicella aestuarii]|uniref:LysR family transcriptional regulator n=1 Tax=Paraneptunicella aestuarii TaxID=2831148 RepID=UPI001E5525DC|nr:LysR family transcriptional regulator [Paraneptunicella aestuarii]UAA37658.1 LysR family transcriptional regulator [Paraneptunicella aestuarii]